MNSATLKDDHQERRKKLSNLLLSKKKPMDRAFFVIVLGAAGYTLFLVALIVYAVGDGSTEIFSYEGLEFFTGTDWNAVYGREAFGALPYIIGTLVTAGIAMVIGVPVSIGIAVFLSEISPPRISTPLSFVIELLAAVPSIVYGLWALFVFRFWIVDLIEKPLYNAFGD